MRILKATNTKTSEKPRNYWKNLFITENSQHSKQKHLFSYTLIHEHIFFTVKKHMSIEDDAKVKKKKIPEMHRGVGVYVTNCYR